MDKYEFNIKIEQLKKLIQEEDYYTALRIVDGIDWNRVRNTNLLVMAATVCEKSERPMDARNILEQAYKRSSVGKRILFKLCELAVKTGDLKAAEDYYYEFRQADAFDTNIYLLQYMILKARHAPYEKQLQPLELFCKENTDERWLYELACTYDYAGRISDSVRTCDRIALMFGGSSYGLKALRLKMRHVALTDEQKNILYPRYNEADSRYKAGSRSTLMTRTASFDTSDLGGHSLTGISPSGYEDYGIEEEPNPSEADVIKQDPVEEYEDTVRKNQEIIKKSNALAGIRYENEDDSFEAYLVASGMSDEKPEARASASPFNSEKAGIDTDLRDSKVTLAEGQNAAFSDVEKDKEEFQAADNQSEESKDEGRQMEFDFTFGSPRVVEESIAEPEKEVEISEEEEIPIRSTISLSHDVAHLQEANSAAEAVKAEVYGLKGAPQKLSETVEASGTKGASQKLSEIASTTVSTLNQAETSSMMKTPPTSEEKRLAVSNADLTPKPVTIDRKKKNAAHHIIVEASSDSNGLNIAIAELKRIHNEFNIKHSSVKTNAEKLNVLGLTSAVLNRISGKDFVIENSGNLRADILKKLYQFIDTDETGSILVFIDTPEGMDHIEDTIPELFDVCAYVSDLPEEEGEDGDYTDSSYGMDDEDEEGDYVNDEDDYENENDFNSDSFDEDDLNGDIYKEDEEDQIGADSKEADLNGEESPLKKRGLKSTKERFSNIKAVQVDPGEEMESDDFAQYCMQYAESIDCSINGTSMLALYERIELMEEDGIPLTKEAAEQLIESAADRAEKPPIGKRLKGLFHSKYDKNGCLILKESDFVY